MTDPDLPERPGGRVQRVGGRVLIVDDSGRVLLIHERLEDGGTHWLTPGGGVERGEDPRAAARREAIEEADIAVVLAGADEVLTTRRNWSWRGTTYDQVDHFYLARVPDGTVARARTLTEVEELTWLEFGWWSVADLHDTAETIVPADLGDVLERLLARPGER